jgi:O-succinylbenzoic acid--CoA ligase
MLTLDEFLAQWHDDNDKVLVHTSGSTGKPKPMWVEKRRMLNSARITCDFLGLKAGDTALLCMPLDYIAGKMVVVRALERKLRLISVTPSGHPLASLPSEKSGIADSELEPLTFAAMVPLQVYNSLQVPEERERLRQIKHLIIGGGAIDDKLARTLRQFPNAVWSTYGMTETLSHIALRRLSGDGASVWYTPFDSVTIDQTPDGCLVIDAPLVHEGRLVTNDRVQLRTDKATGRRQFRVLGRKDNVIDSGGIKIQIEEVEHTLKPFLRAPFAITKLPDEKFGEVVVLLSEQSDKAELEEICMNALPHYWVPRRYFHVDRVPMTETGKIARQQAADLAMMLAEDSNAIYPSR